MARGNRGRPNKAKAIKAHARRRAYERLGVVLSNDLHAGLVRQIVKGTARLVRKESNRVTIFEVELAGQLVEVAYDKERKLIVTVLPPEETLGSDPRNDPDEES